MKAAHGEEPPLVVDPFAGGGSIPLEALRLGCEAFASDLNPVACLILKVMLEDIPRHGPKLAEDLRRVGAEIKRQAEKELADSTRRTRTARRPLLPLGPDGALRVAELRRGDPARALVLALQEGEAQVGAQAPGRAARPASRRASNSRSSSRVGEGGAGWNGDAREGYVCRVRRGAPAGARAGATCGAARRGRRVFDAKGRRTGGAGCSRR